MKPLAGGQHIGFGTRNALVGLGDAYLELMGLDPQQTIALEDRFFQLNADSTPRFAAWCARADRSLEHTVEIARLAGVELGPILKMSRKRPDGTTLAWSLTSPFAEREGGILPFYIDWGGSPNPASTMQPQLAIRSLSITHPDADRIGAILEALGEQGVGVHFGVEPRLNVALSRTSAKRA